MNRHNHIYFNFVLISLFFLFVLGCSPSYIKRYGISPYDWTNLNHEQRKSTVKAYFGEDSIIVGRIEIYEEKINFEQLELSVCTNEHCSDLLDNNALEAFNYVSRDNFDFAGFRFQKAVGENDIIYAHKVKYFYKRAPKGQYFIKVVEPIPDKHQGIISRFYISKKKVINVGTLKVIQKDLVKSRFFGRDLYNFKFEFIKDDRPIKALGFRLPYAFEVYKDSIIDID